jgi:hypothetical protein
MGDCSLDLAWIGAIAFFNQALGSSILAELVTFLFTTGQGM